MRTRLLLIRHARSAWNAEGRWQGRADPPLDATGVAQAHKLAAHLKQRGETPAAIYTSPQIRAAETARIVAAAFALAPVQDEHLREFDAGEFEGLTAPDVQARYPDWWANFTTTRAWLPIPGAEPRDETCDRAIGAIEAVAERHRGATVALVSHGGLLGAYLTCALGIPRDSASPFSFGNASLTIVEHQPVRVRLLLLNDQCHLAGEEH